MPYSLSRPSKDLKKRLKKTYPKITANEIRQFIHVFNSVYKKHKDEERAFASAYAALKRNKKLKKKKKSKAYDKIAKLANYLDGIIDVEKLKRIKKLISLT